MDLKNLIEESESLIRSGDYDEAITTLTGVLAEEPDNRAALLALGIAYTESGSSQKALKTLHFYLTRDQESDLAWEALGCALLRLNRNAEAEEALMKARALNPQNATVLRNLSVLMSKTNRGHEAYKLLKRSYEIDNEDYLTMYAMACAYRQLGRFDKALPLFGTLRAIPSLPGELREDSALQHLELSLGWG